jgi:hypothetical protein
MAEDEPRAAHHLPLLNARTWAIGFFVFAIVIAVVFAEFLIGFIANSH